MSFSDHNKRSLFQFQNESTGPFWSRQGWISDMGIDDPMGIDGPTFVPKVAISY